MIVVTYKNSGEGTWGRFVYSTNYRMTLNILQTLAEEGKGMCVPSSWRFWHKKEESEEFGTLVVGHGIFNSFLDLVSVVGEIKYISLPEGDMFTGHFYKYALEALEKGQ